MGIPHYIAFQEVVKRLPYSAKHIRRMIADGNFPKPVKLSVRRSAFVEQDIVDWLESKHAESSP